MSNPLTESGSGRALLLAAAFVILVAGIKAAEAIMVPMMLAAFIATISGTPVFWLHRKGMPVGLAVLVVMLVVVGFAIGVGAIVGQSVNAFIAALPDYEARLRELAGAGISLLNGFGVEVNRDTVLETFDPGTAMNLVGSTLKGFGAVLSNGFLILLTVIFILTEASSFPQKLRAILHDPDSSLPYFSRVTETVNRYMYIKTLVSLATGALVTGWLLFLGVDFPFLWGMLAFLFNYVPNIGSIIAAVPAVLLALVQLGPLSAGLVAAGYMAVNIGMGNGVEPRFMGRGLGLSTLVVFLSLVFWGWMLGPVGMLLSVPLTMTVKIALEANPNTHWVALILGPESEAREELEEETSGTPEPEDLADLPEPEDMDEVRPA